MSVDSTIDQSQWGWLQDTYWYVPPENLPALQFVPDENTLDWVIDQTVWHITALQDGYFWGSSATAALPAGSKSSQESASVKPICFSMVGSITPEGRVYITFILGRASSSRTATTGIGRAVSHNNHWSLEMQMSTGNSKTTAHWAYMTRVKPDDPSWKSLPGVGISVPQMLQGCQPPQVENTAQ
jgi:hypothetical protein